MEDWIGTLSPIFQWKRFAVRRPTIAPVRVASQAFNCSGGRMISGCILRKFLRVNGILHEEIFRVLINAAEPGLVRREVHAGNPVHPRLVADRQEVDERNLLADDQPVRARQFHAADQRLLDGRQNPEQHERHDDGQQRQRGAQFFPRQVAPDEVDEFHFTGSLVSCPLFK